MSGRDFFGGVLSDLRSPGMVGRPAGDDLVWTCAGDGKVEIYDMLRPPGRPRFVAMTYIVTSCMCYVSANMGDLREAPFFVFLHKAYSPQLATTGTRAQGMGHYSG